MDRQKEYKSENKMKDCLAYFHLSPVLGEGSERASGRNIFLTEGLVGK